MVCHLNNFYKGFVSSQLSNDANKIPNAEVIFDDFRDIVDFEDRDDCQQVSIIIQISSFITHLFKTAHLHDYSHAYRKLPPSTIYYAEVCTK